MISVVCICKWSVLFSYCRLFPVLITRWCCRSTSCQKMSRYLQFCLQLMAVVVAMAVSETAGLCIVFFLQSVRVRSRFYAFVSWAKMSFCCGVGSNSHATYRLEFFLRFSELITFPCRSADFILLLHCYKRIFWNLVTAIIILFSPTIIIVCASFFAFHLTFWVYYLACWCQLHCKVIEFVVANLSNLILHAMWYAIKQKKQFSNF